MDWKSLVDEQKKEIERNHATIDQNNSQLASNSKKLGDLRYKLAEQSEKLNNLSETNSNTANDRISKLQLGANILEEQKADYLKRADAAEAAFKASLQKLKSQEQDIAALKSKLQQKDAQSQTASHRQVLRASNDDSLDDVKNLQSSLQAAHTENVGLRQQVQSLQRQLEAEAKERVSSWSAKNRDQDDDESVPANLLHKELSTQPSAPIVSPFSNRSSGYQQPPARSANPYARDQTVSKQSPPSKQGAAKKAAPVPKPMTIPFRPTLTTQKSPLKQKGPAKTDGPQRASTTKRKRSEQEELAQELLELSPGMAAVSDNFNSTQSRAPRKKQRASSPKFVNALNFNGNGFIAIMNYAADGTVDSHYESKDMRDMPMDDLKERIEQMVNVWEQKKGECWDMIFKEKGYNARARACVTKKMTGGRVGWREGCEGKYACRDCVTLKQPCFTWNAAREDFMLLPLHEDDRRLPVREGFEIRYWMNEMTEAEMNAARDMDLED